ncbi:MAG: hypothetical protein C4551_05795 [Bacillota bacterium]|nr:MAG: hypothetical protein C4551_05795 [Bacillota bacterium]
MLGLEPQLRATLLGLAQTRCVDYIRRQPPMAGREDLAYVVVGSVATGLVTSASSIDIAVMADKDAFKALTQDPAWNGERPWDAFIDGASLKYYCVAYDQVEQGLRELRDSYVYYYGSAVIIHDPTGKCAEFMANVRSALPDLRRQRLEGKLDMLRRRFSAMEAAFRYRDVMAAAAICVEMVTLAIKVTALLDDVPFDPRSQLFLGGLAGRVGYQVEGIIRKLIGHIGELEYLGQTADTAAFRFPARMVELINILSDEARSQGFEVGLEKPDPRCAEV